MGPEAELTSEVSPGCELVVVEDQICSRKFGSYKHVWFSENDVVHALQQCVN
jgi:hypothetical protein